VLPDNFHVHVKVMTTTTKTVNFLGQSYDINYQINAPKERGRSLNANLTHSLDGMVVREITLRADLDKEKMKELRSLVETHCDDICVASRPNSLFWTEKDKTLFALWDHYKASGYLSARILEVLDEGNLYYVTREAVLELIDSLPPTRFDVLSVHDRFCVHPNYGNDIRRQYIYQLAVIARSNLLSYLLSQALGTKITINKDDPDMWMEILTTEYPLS
jgi:hypothetical protein